MHEIKCPWCGVCIVIAEINCGIFRCGIIKSTNQPIAPHAPKMECDRLFNDGLIWGCSKPFKFGGDKVEKCDYI